MDITPETIADMAARDVALTPEDALGYIDNVLVDFKGSRRDHDILWSAYRTLRGVIRAEAALRLRVAELENDLAGALGESVGDGDEAEAEALRAVPESVDMREVARARE